MNMWSVAALVLLVNLPFGYWRANSPKFSRQWFLAVHIPVPIVIVLRIVSGLGFQFATFPFMIGAFFLGQLIGGRLHGILERRTNVRVSACLVWDIVTGLINTQKSGLG